MKAVFVAVVFALFGAVLGAEPCCTPRQWEGNLSEWGGAAGRYGHPQFIEENIFYAYDEENERVAAVVKVDDGYVRTVANYAEEKMYIIHGSRCKSFRLRQRFQRACTGNSTFLGSFHFGAGTESLKLNAWKAHVRGMKVIFSTTPENCIPVSEAIAGRTRRESFAISMGYTGITVGIKDPRIFNHPSTCEPSNLTDLDDHFEELGMSTGATYVLKKVAQE